MKSAVPSTLLILTCCAAMASAGETLTCPTLDKSQYPALVYTEGPTLHVAHFKSGQAHRQQVTFRDNHNLYLERLRDGVFLAGESWRQDGGPVHIVDLNAGIVKPLSENGGPGKHHTLHISPEGKRALLLYAVKDVPGILFIELDLSTYETKTTHILDRDFTGNKRDKIHNLFRLSPDFTHLAYAIRHLPAGAVRPSTSTLKVFSFDTAKICELDPRVHVWLCPLSSSGYGLPALEWIDNREILYQNMPTELGANDFWAMEGDYALKTVGIQTGTIVTRDVQEGRLMISGGNFAYDVDRDRIVYKRHPDIKTKVETAKPIVPRFRRERGAAGHTIMDGETILYQGKRLCSGESVSPSGKHFAYVLQRDRSKDIPYEIFVKLEGRAEPLKVGVVESHPRVGWWIEGDANP